MLDSTAIKVLPRFFKSEESEEFFTILHNFGFPICAFLQIGENHLTTKSFYVTIIMSKGSSSQRFAVRTHRHDSRREARCVPSKRCNKTFGVMWITLKVFF